MLLNRHQNYQQIIYYNPETSSFRQIYEYRNEKYIEEPTIFSYLGDGKYMIASDRDGYQHIYIVSSGKITPVTFGQYEVTAFYGMDDSGWLYFQSSERDPSQRHIYKKNINSGEERQLVLEPGVHNAAFSGDHAYFVNTYTAQGIPPVISVIDQNGKVVRVIENNKDLQKELAKFWRPREFMSIPAGEYDIKAWMITPPDFDENKKYPVLIFVYGGPGAQRVMNEYLGSLDLWFQLLAQKGYIVLCNDNRGTPGRGSEYMKANYLQLGKVEVEDQIKVIDYLKTLPYVDGGRIGYYGWSYGAYMSLLMLFQGGGTVKAALSIAPVTHWKFYDTIYTERFMRTPKENPSGYDDGSPLMALDQWKSGKLFLAHGTADDNVHFQNTAELVKKMNSSGKHYDLYIYPDGDHGMGGYLNRYHLYQKMTSFILENL
jgi:dipeptidyl-peptidase-4